MSSPASTADRRGYWNINININMKIDGKIIASDILEDLKQRVEKLKEKNIFPHLYIILLSDDISSKSYVNQKILKSEKVGIKITLDRKSINISNQELIKEINRLNNDMFVHGIIVQRPMPESLNEEAIAKAIIPEKDVDGFNPDSKFGVPVALAVLKMLETCHPKDFNNWLIQQRICVIGKGITAGKPIINALQKLGIKPQIVDSKTENRSKILKESDIIISAVGKTDVFKSSEIKNNAILIGVGLHKGNDEKFYGDFGQEVENTALFYSPTPGGVGPVNVSMLLKNLVKAAENQTIK